MTVRSGKEALAVALAQDHNVPGTCQANVHNWYGAPSVGDVDHDGDADAVDGWESEPKKYRHPGDRKPPHTVPLSFHGGSRGFGHRCMLGAHDGRIRSTDVNGNVYAPGTTGTVSAATTAEAIAIIEQMMGVTYTGWSETISGELIPDFEQKPGKPPAPQTRGTRVDLSLRKLRQAQAIALKHGNKLRAKAIGAAIQSLLALPTRDKKK